MRGLIGAAQVMEFNDVATYFSRFNDDHATALLKIFEELSDKGEGLINNNKLKADITKNEIRIDQRRGHFEVEAFGAHVVHLES